MSNRKKAEALFIKRISALAKNKRNVEMYTEYFGGLSDREFDRLIDRLEEGSAVLPFYAANMGQVKVEVADLLKVGDAMGIDFFERIWMVDAVSGVRHLTPEKYLVVNMPVRRQSQHLTKGKSINEDDRHVDNLTGQPIGPSRTSRLSLPELTILSASGHDSAIEELIKTRGGDTEAYRLSKRTQMDTGEYTLAAAAELNTRPVATVTLRSFLLGMALDNNL